MRNCGRGAPEFDCPIIWLAGALSANHNEPLRPTRGLESGFEGASHVRRLTAQTATAYTSSRF